MMTLGGLNLIGQLNWGVGDFVFVAVIFFGGLAAYRFVSRRGQGSMFHTAVVLSLVTALSMIWITLAVGIIGSEDNQANIMYVGVLGIGLLGSLIARFRATGMSRTMVTVTMAQLVVTVVAVTIWKPETEEHAFSTFILNLFYVMLFLSSALLFRRASRER
jgi:uncharacterized membrane protein YoaK (UPF0700 family)